MRLERHTKHTTVTRKGLLLLCAFILLTGCAKQSASVVEIAPTPTLMPTSAPTPTPTLAPTPVPTPADPLTAPEGAYTIGWLSDTQHYSDEHPDTFYAMTDFLRAEQDRLKLGYVVFTGDFVHRYANEGQWETASGAMEALADIPHGVLAGNHDTNYSHTTYDEFRRYFGAARYENKPWYGTTYQDNQGHYDLVDLGGTQYIFVYMGYDADGPDGSAVKWINAVLRQHPDRVGALCVHDYFKTDMTRSNAGQTLYRKVVAKSPNLYLVFCGHRYNQEYVESAFDDDGDGATDRVVYEMISNYQAAGTEGGSGYMRFIQIDEAQGTMTWYSYSPVTRDYVYYDDPATQSEKYAADPAAESGVLPIPWVIK